MNEELLIQYKGVEINQQALCVLHDVNFELHKGQFVYIIGKVGSGKSTFLKTIYGELEITGGEAMVLGYTLKKMKQKKIAELRRKLGIVFQDFQLLTDRTVHDNLEFVLRATGWKQKHEIENRIEEVLKLVGMAHKGYKMPNELSGGEQQRIVIARAILNKPAIILADEPTGNLDRKNGEEIIRLLKEANRKQKQTLILITHDESIALQADRILEIEDGQIKRDERIRVIGGNV